MAEIEPGALVKRAKSLMIEALELLDRAEAWEASAHLDLALTHLDATIFHREAGQESG